MKTTNTTVPTTEVITFEFRSKFQKLLNDENRSAIVYGFRNFCRLQPGDARYLLWNLTYQFDFSISFDKLDIDSDVIPAEGLLVFRNELRYQYQILHPDFLAISVLDCCQEAYTKLSASSDPITAYMVYNQLTSKLFSPIDYLERPLFLLESDKENFYFGGLCEVGFSKEEADYLKVFHTEIGDLFRAMCDYRISEYKADTQNLPFAGLDKRLEEVGFQYAPEYSGNARENPEQSGDAKETVEVSEVTVAVPTSISDTVKDEANILLTPLEILEHKDLISSLVFSEEIMALLQGLRACGFDLNEVLEKAGKIKSLLESAKDLSA